MFRFNDVDVDNDDIISMVEQTPTAHRSSAMLRRIYEKNYGGSAPEKQNGDGKRPGRARERDAHLCHHRLRQYAPGIDAADGRMNAYSGKGNADSVSLH